MDSARRRFLAIAALTPAALVCGRTASAADQTSCTNLAALPLAQKRQRRAIGYVEPSSDPAKRCGRCAFFTASGKPDGCGTCQLLSSGPVAAAALCNSFAVKRG